MASVNGVKSSIVLIFAVCVATPLGLSLRGQHIYYNPDHIDFDGSPDSHPGTPESPGVTNNPSKWQEKLGLRLFRAAQGHDAMKACGSFYSFGDYTWCDKAMPAKTEFANKGPYNGHTYKGLSNSIESGPVSNGQFLGLSYGVSGYDPWSELMSNRYFVDTRIHDCYYDGKEGPMASDQHAGFSKKKQCKSRRCYSLPYKAKRVCLGADHQVQKGRKFEPLSAGLKDRPPLSTFVKIDAEGSEWSALEQLLASPEDLEKVRTLDLELHFQIGLGNKPIEETLEHRVKIIEQLAQVFAVTGTTIEPLHRTLAAARSKDPSHGSGGWVESKVPPKVFLTNGLSLDQYCISFVNRKLL